MSSSAYRNPLIVSPQNIQYLHKICTQFLQEKYNIEISDKNLRAFLQASIQELTQTYTLNPPFPPVEDFNKRVIIRVKDKVILFVRENSMPSHPPPPHKIVKPKEELRNNIGGTSEEQQIMPQAPTEEQARTHTTLENMLPPPTMVSLPSNDEDAEETFARKLQELELQRSATIAQRDQVVSSSLSPPVQKPYIVAPSPTPPPPSSAPTVLYVPTVTNISKFSKSIVIHSAERLWDYFHDRNTFMWAGPTPDSSSLCIVSLLLPSIVASQTPVVEINIHGAGGHQIDVHCVCSHRSGAAWDIWKPASLNETSLRTIACPWNIQLRDVLHQPLDLGLDGFTIQEAAIMPRGTTTRLKLSSNAHIQKGSILMFKDIHGNITKLRVVQVSDLGVEVEGDHTSTEGKICGIWDMQSSIVMEVTKNESSESVKPKL